MKFWYFLPEVNNTAYFWHLSAGLLHTRTLKLLCFRSRVSTPNTLNISKAHWMYIASFQCTFSVVQCTFSALRPKKINDGFPLWVHLGNTCIHYPALHYALSGFLVLAQADPWVHARKLTLTFDLDPWPWHQHLTLTVTFDLDLEVR